MSDIKTPYLNGHMYEFDLCWLVEKILSFESQLNQAIDLKTIHYADPIQWDITTQYAPNTVVVDSKSGTAYMSKVPVPAGILLGNTDYWVVIFNYQEIYTKIMEGVAFYNGQNPYASKALLVNDLVWYGLDLYRVTKPIEEGGKLIPETNMVKTSIESLLSNYYGRDRMTTLLNDTLNISENYKINAKDRVSTLLNDTLNISGNYTINAGDIAETASNKTIKITNDLVEDIDGKRTTSIKSDDWFVHFASKTQNLFRKYVSPEDFKTDTMTDTDAIKQALESGYPVIGYGVYNITETIELSANQILVLNEVRYTGNDYAFILNGDYIRLSVNRLTSSKGGFSFIGGLYDTLDCHYASTETDVINMTSINSGISRFTVTLGYVKSNTTNGITIEARNFGIYDGILQGNDIVSSNGDGIHMTNKGSFVGEIKLYNLRIEAPTSYAIVIQLLSDNEFTGVIGYGLSLESSKNGIYMDTTTGGIRTISECDIQFRAVEISQAGGTVIRATGNGRISAKLHVDDIHLSSINPNGYTASYDNGAIWIDGNLTTGSDAYNNVLCTKAVITGYGLFPIVDLNHTTSDPQTTSIFNSTANTFLVTAEPTDLYVPSYYNEYCKPLTYYLLSGSTHKLKFHTKSSDGTDVVRQTSWNGGGNDVVQIVKANQYVYLFIAENKIWYQNI